MTAFNFFSHGTQDVYPTFLKKQHDFGADVVSTIAIAYNIAAIIGGIIAGALSQRFGRRRLIVIFALLALPCIPLWAFASHSWWLGVGAFLVQFMVQGAWGVVPAYLNETMPAAARAVLPGFIYQFGNLIASGNGPRPHRGWPGEDVRRQLRAGDGNRRGLRLIGDRRAGAGRAY